MTATPLQRVHFLVAGVQKGGTTALFEYLNEHPDLNMAPEKEVHFFDDEAVDWSAPDYAAYHRRFLVADSERLNGEVTPIYTYWPNCLERIHSYDPGMRLILLFRDPVARAWSQWRMEYARGAETEPFAWCIRDGRRRLDQGEPPGFHRVYSYVERGFYGAQLRRLKALFPPEKLLLIRSRDLDCEPEAVIRRVSAFLGVREPADVRPRRVHVSAPVPGESGVTSADVAHLRSVFAEDAAEFTRLSGLELEPEL